MVKARTWFTLFIMALGTVAATASCGSDEGTGGSSGNGSVLSGGSAGTGGKPGSVGRAGSSGSSPTAGDSTLGAKCTSDAQCGDGMVCLTPSSTSLNGGGPAGGMCTLACTGTPDCTALSPSSDCFNFGTAAAPKLFCLDGCTQGGTDATTAATKCLGRSDFACIDFSQTAVPDPFCVPLCRSDLECGTGLYCNKGSGLCSKTKPTGDPVGTACTPGAATDTCEGFCIRTTADGVTPIQGTCAEFCSGFLDCMYTGDKPGGLCGGPLSDTFGIYDLGYCLPSCGCTADCPFKDDKCRAWTTAEQDFATDLGAKGLCYPNTTDSTELTCGDQGAAGAGGDSSTGEPGAAGASGAPN